jgi:CRP/FNR family cyclic AMP-dependent transcriptional regulator
VVLESDSGDNLVLATLGPGRIFGEMSLLDGEPRAASVVSTARSHVLGFFKADLMDLTAHSPSLGFKIIYRLGQLMQERLIETLGEYRNIEQSTRRDLRREQVGLSGKGNGAPARA